MTVVTTLRDWKVLFSEAVADTAGLDGCTSLLQMLFRALLKHHGPFLSFN